MGRGGGGGGGVGAGVRRGGVCGGRPPRSGSGAWHFPLVRIGERGQQPVGRKAARLPRRGGGAGRGGARGGASDMMRRDGGDGPACTGACFEAGQAAGGRG